MKKLKIKTEMLRRNGPVRRNGPMEGVKTGTSNLVLA